MYTISSHDSILSKHGFMDSEFIFITLLNYCSTQIALGFPEGGVFKSLLVVFGRDPIFNRFFGLCFVYTLPTLNTCKQTPKEHNK